MVQTGLVWGNEWQRGINVSWLVHELVLHPWAIKIVAAFENYFRAHVGRCQLFETAVAVGQMKMINFIVHMAYHVWDRPVLRRMQMSVLNLQRKIY